MSKEYPLILGKNVAEMPNRKWTEEEKKRFAEWGEYITTRPLDKEEIELLELMRKHKDNRRRIRNDFTR